MKRWPIKFLPEIAFFQEGPGVRKWQFRSAGIKLINVGNIVQGQLDLSNTDRHLDKEEAEKTYSHFLLKAGDLVMATSGATWGKVAFVEPYHLPLCLNTSVVRFRPLNTEVCDPMFLRAFFETEAFRQQVERLITGSAQPNFGPSHLKQIFLPLPLLAEQKRIVTLLNEADKLRKLRAQADRRTATLISALFHEMFGGRKFTSIRVGELTSLVTSGATPRGGEEIYVSEGPYFIRSQNVQMNWLDLSDAACLPREVHEQMLRTKVATGDVLLNITGASIGRVAWIDKIDHEANVSQHVCLIRPKADLLTAAYLSVFISLPATQQFILQVQAGASRQALNHQQVRALEIPLPPLSLQKEFAKQVSEIRELEAEQAVSRKRLDDLFQSMLHRAFNGEL